MLVDGVTVEYRLSAHLAFCRQEGLHSAEQMFVVQPTVILAVLWHTWWADLVPYGWQLLLKSKFPLWDSR